MIAYRKEPESMSTGCILILFSIFFILSLILTILYFEVKLLVFTIVFGLSAFIFASCLIIEVKRPEIIFEQKKDDIYIYPNTKKEKIIAISKIVDIEKKHRLGRALQELEWGKLTIITKNERYVLDGIDDLHDVHKQFKTLLERRNKN